MGVFGAVFGRRGDAGFSGALLVVSSGVVGFNVAMFVRPVREIFRPARPGVGASAKKFALQAQNGLKTLFLGALGELFCGRADGGGVLGELFCGRADGGVVLGEFFRGSATGGAVLGEFFAPWDWAACRLVARPGPAAHGYRSQALRSLRRSPHRGHLLCRCAQGPAPASSVVITP